LGIGVFVSRRFFVQAQSAGGVGFVVESPASDRSGAGGHAQESHLHIPCRPPAGLYWQRLSRPTLLKVCRPRLLFRPRWFGKVGDLEITRSMDCVGMGMSCWTNWCYRIDSAAEAVAAGRGRFRLAIPRNEKLLGRASTGGDRGSPRPVEGQFVLPFAPVAPVQDIERTPLGQAGGRPQ